MSGPISVLVLGNPIAALLSAAALHAAEAVHAGYEHAERLREEHASRQDAERQAQRAAREQDHGRQAESCAREDAEFRQLLALAERLGIADPVRALQPQRPDAGDAFALAAYANQMQALNGHIRAILLTEAARQQQSLPEQLSELDAGDAPPAVSLAQRLLARIAHLGAPPEHVAAIARELERELPGPRAAGRRRSTGSSKHGNAPRR